MASHLDAVIISAALLVCHSALSFDKNAKGTTADSSNYYQSSGSNVIDVVVWYSSSSISTETELINLLPNEEGHKFCARCLKELSHGLRQ